MLSLDASVELTSIAGTRVLPLEAFLTGYRQTALQPDELLTAVLIPRGAADDARSAFLKLGLRRYLVISVVMVAVVGDVGPGRSDHRGQGGRRGMLAGGATPAIARVAAGRRSSIDDVDVDMVAGHLAALTPIDDVRATADYRRRAAAELVRRALRGCGGGA